MSRKRGNGEGSVYRTSSGLWRGSYVAYTAAGAKRRYVSGKTRAEASKKLTKAMADRDGGFVYDDEGFTVADYLGRWLRDSARGTVRESTFERYGHAVDLHIGPALGRLKLKALTPAHVRGFYRDRLDSGLSPATVHKLHVVLHKALDQAVADGLIPRNATDAVKVPRVDREEINPLTADEAGRLIEAANGDRLEALYVLAIHTGLRQGELLALKWEDVDIGEGVPGGALRVRRTLSRRKGTYTFAEPKTKKSRRVVRLTSQATSALRGHLARQIAEMEALGSLYKPGGLVFAGETGGTINPSNLRNRSFARVLERARLAGRGVRFHDLRHTCATLLLSKNVNPKVVSEMLGHASIAITLDTYSHVLPDMQEKAALALEEALK
jgi:integrase